MTLLSPAVLFEGPFVLLGSFLDLVDECSPGAIELILVSPRPKDGCNLAEVFASDTRGCFLAEAFTSDTPGHTESIHSRHRSMPWVAITVLGCN